MLNREQFAICQRRRKCRRRIGICRPIGPSRQRQAVINVSPFPIFTLEMYGLAVGYGNKTSIRQAEMLGVFSF